MATSLCQASPRRIAGVCLFWEGSAAYHQESCVTETKEVRGLEARMADMQEAGTIKWSTLQGS